ncbi:hypothetical protein [Streptomyces hoynatensis]|uniref:Antitoxin n=1 Tax=Streptomyces hoynatensis TaxID=1141874 RepID=A0A3A9YNM2_9ACTN|nr:hypothetical protein [Streptomyces hoynatensis]RKN37768.1 hypothetical protein D7294_26815 [Streptomyces hoynatensis]
MGIADQFRDRAKELQRRAKEAMGNDEEARRRRSQMKNDLLQRGKEAHRRAVDRARENTRENERGRDEPEDPGR